MHNLLPFSVPLSVYLVCNYVGNHKMPAGAKTTMGFVLSRLN